MKNARWVALLCGACAVSFLAGALLTEAGRFQLAVTRDASLFLRLDTRSGKVKIFELEDAPSAGRLGKYTLVDIGGLLSDEAYDRHSQ